MLDASLFKKEFGLFDKEVLFNEPLAPRTWIKTGGGARFFVNTESLTKISNILNFCCKRDIPVFFLGNGSNLVVSDRGFDGVVITTASLRDEILVSEISQGSDFFYLTISSAYSVDEIVKFCCQRNLEGLEYFFGLPGTVGGAVFMNASCYGHSWSEVFIKAKILYSDGVINWVIKKDNEWGYKKSPFQVLGGLILSVVIQLFEGCGSSKLLEVAQSCYQDRKQKGHYCAPCAGSIFKNNRNYGRPSGQIIDSLGLKGFTLGGAQISPWHANILINTGTASSQEIYDLTFYVQKRVKEAYGYHLEPEVIFLGDFS